MINSKGKKYFVKQRRAGVLFILPSMLIFIIFVFVPLIMSFIYSTQTFNMMFNNVKFVRVFYALNSVLRVILLFVSCCLSV